MPYGIKEKTMYKKKKHSKRTKTKRYNKQGKKSSTQIKKYGSSRGGIRL